MGTHHGKCLPGISRGGPGEDPGGEPGGGTNSPPPSMEPGSAFGHTGKYFYRHLSVSSKTLPKSQKATPRPPNVRFVMDFESILGAIFHESSRFFEKRRKHDSIEKTMKINDFAPPKLTFSNQNSVRFSSFFQHFFPDLIFPTSDAH